MNKFLTAAIAAITLGGAVSATATAADARPYYGGHYGHRGNGGAAVAAGIAGLAIGAALASDHPHYYRGYYDGPYYGPAYYGPGYYGTCYTTRWTWDPYIGRRVPVREAYAC
ncbi:hypothetical protein [Phenylobacterium sp.]|uniref:hypothetical protein n=1 Tax=Phenylobacterium sp. TaxID=1871053 RepID=UPI002E31047C|nr:hypothetical protein [Phenylobacterium sp.]HEX3363717.1 hypothetical protein [Phenylobacterium sp.]